MSEWVRAVVPAPATLVAHDRGGFIGLRVLAGDAERFAPTPCSSVWYRGPRRSRTHQEDVGPELAQRIAAFVRAT